MKEKTDQERTCKIKIEKIPDFVLKNKKEYRPLNLKQYYLDYTNNHCNYLIKQVIKLRAKKDSTEKNSTILRAIRDAKIMVDEVGNNEYKYKLIVKYGRNFLNERKEQEIPADVAEELIRDYTTSVIEKMSYQIVNTKEYKIDIDKYINDSPETLIVCVINYNNMTKNEAIDTLKKEVHLKDGEFTDITLDLKFTNRNLKSANK